MLCLTENDILNTLTPNEVMDVIESAMILNEKKEFYMPPRSHLDQGENTLLIMPCFLDDVFGTKLVTIFPDNAAKNEPVTNGVMLLNEGETGRPLALLNGLVLTAMRTGAVGGTSVRYLTPENSKTAGVIGTGGQGFYQAIFVCAARKITDLYIYDQSEEKAADFRARLLERIQHVKVHIAKSVEELVEASEIIITTTTSKEPVLPDNAGLLKNKHFVGVGSFKPGMREYPKALFGLLDKLFIDTEHAIEETGDLTVPLENKWIAPDQVTTLGKFLIEDINKDKAKEGTTFFKTVGMALFDLYLSQHIYKRAIEKGLGQDIKL